jgi:beta-glucosidase
MHWIRLCLLGLVLGFAGSQAAADTTPAPAANNARDAFVENLMRQMTLKEKIGQLRLISVGGDNPLASVEKQTREGQIGGIFNTVVRPAIRRLQDDAVKHSRLHIPMFFAYDVVHGHRTVFPIGLGLASSWDMDAIASSGRIAAEEASADGLNMTFAPMVDLTRDPRWGRVSEGFGEDTYLTSRIAAALVNSYQENDLTAKNTIMAGVKHFALYGAAEGGRDYNTVDMSLPKMYQDYFPPYKAAVDAGAGAVMVSLNAINGVPATANKWLLQDVLRKQWGFKGLIVSDHGAIMELIKHGVARDVRQAAELAIDAGIDMSMNDTLYGTQLEPLLAAGKISESQIDDACRRVLEAKYDLGLFSDPYRHVGNAADDPVDTDAESRLHRDAARRIARESLVLLKNVGQTLPLKKTGVIAVVGPLAKSQRDVIGSWSAAGKARQAVSAYAGIENAVGNRARVIYAKGANITNDPAVVDYLNIYEPDVEVTKRSPPDMIAEALRAAEQADVVVAVVGESQGMAHEASSRTDITIPDSQRDLLGALKATGKPLVIVLMNGRPLALEWENANADAMLETWFSGTEGGNAIADVLFGDVNPSGKLTMSFPRSVGQIPIYYNHLNTGRPFDPEHPNKYTSRYFDATNGALFPFGFGLSYTTFALSNLRLSAKTMTKGGSILARVNVKNTGKRTGETVVQLYLQDVSASLSRPIRELKNFTKLELKPGESRDVVFNIPEEDLKFFNSDLKWADEPGEFRVFAGLDSSTTLQKSFHLE